MGFVAWAVLFAAIMIVEALGLILRGHQWPTLSDIFRVAMRPEWSRWLLFALWLRVGWHFFIRGWTFFMRGPGARAPRHSLGGGKAFTQIVQQVIIPIVTITWRANARGARAAARAPTCAVGIAGHAPRRRVRHAMTIGATSTA